MNINKECGLQLSGLHGGVAEYPAGASLGPRRMSDYEFVWIMRGQADYQQNDIPFRAPAGSIILSRPGVTERYLWDSQGPTRHAYFHFRLLYIPSTFGKPAQWPVVRVMPTGDMIRPLFEMLALALDGSGSAAMTWEKMAETILSAFVLGPLTRESAIRGTLPLPVRLAMNWASNTLAEDPRRPLRLHDLAKAGFVDPKHLCRLFRQAGCKSPMQSVLELRLHRARNLLERTDFKMARIADICGFANPYHFSRCFAACFGMPPRAARRQAVGL